MKQIFLIIFFAVGLAYAQQKIPVISDIAYFYADSISTTITIGKNEFLAQIWLDADRSLSVWPQLYDASKAQWSWVLDNGAILVYTTSDVTLDFVIPLEPRRFYIGKSIRWLLAADIADTMSMRYEKRPY